MIMYGIFLLDKKINKHKKRLKLKKQTITQNIFILIKVETKSIY